MSITIQSICCPLVLRLTLNNMVKSSAAKLFRCLYKCASVFFMSSFAGFVVFLTSVFNPVSCFQRTQLWVDDGLAATGRRRTATSAICWGSLLSYCSGHVHCWVEYSTPQKATRKGGDVCSPVAWHQPLYGHPQIPCIEWPCLVGLASSASCSTRFIYTKLGHAVAGGLWAAASAPFSTLKHATCKAFQAPGTFASVRTCRSHSDCDAQNHWNVFSFRWGLTTPCPLGLFLIFNCFGIHFFKTYIKGRQAISTPLLVSSNKCHLLVYFTTFLIFFPLTLSIIQTLPRQTFVRKQL